MKTLHNPSMVDAEWRKYRYPQYTTEGLKPSSIPLVTSGIYHAFRSKCLPPLTLYRETGQFSVRARWVSSGKAKFGFDGNAHRCNFCPREIPKTFTCCSSVTLLKHLENEAPEQDGSFAAVLWSKSTLLSQHCRGSFKKGKAAHNKGDKVTSHLPHAAHGSPTGPTAPKGGGGKSWAPRGILFILSGTTALG